ncbi:MAG: DUF2147 domain-containing protein [Chitinophagales bacterium]|nr:DUF2147 domain-containing protein [Chitinophagales bacterium]
MKKTLVLLLIICSLAAVKAQNSIEGIWYNTTKSGKVEIYKKGEAYFGKIIWLKEPIDEKTGKAKVDSNNPNEEKRNTPIIGLLILKDFSKDGNNSYSGGTVYDPENGKTYKCKMTLVDANNLDVRGYIGFPALGRTENWTRTTK